MFCKYDLKGSNLELNESQLAENLLANILKTDLCIRQAKMTLSGSSI